MSFEGKKNVYMCCDCGHGFVSMDVDEGVTPFTAPCLNCDGLAKSFFYNIPQEILGNHAVEWFRPSAKASKKLPKPVREHVERGGLIIQLNPND